MSSCERRRLCLSALAALTLAACGFTPVYGPGGGAQALQNAVAVNAPGTPEDYLLVRRLEERLGRGDGARYTLDTAITTGRDGLAITSDGKTTRYNLTGEARYVLRGPGDAVLADGTVRNFVGYSATGSTVATQAAERDARLRLMEILADQIVDRLIVAVPGPA